MHVQILEANKTILVIPKQSIGDKDVKYDITKAQTLQGSQ